LEATSNIETEELIRRYPIARDRSFAITFNHKQLEQTGLNLPEGKPIRNYFENLKKKKKKQFEGRSRYPYV